MKKSDVIKMVNELKTPTWAQAGPDDTSYPAQSVNPSSMEKSGAETLTVTNEPDVSGDTGWNPRIKTENKKKKGGKMSDAQYGKLSDELGLKVLNIETDMKSVLKDWKAAEGDAKKPFVEKLKDLTADKKAKNKEMDELDAKFDAQAPPEMEIDKDAMDEDTEEMDYTNVSHLNEYNSAIYDAFGKIGRAKAKYFGEGQEIELELIPTHAHRRFPDVFIYKPNPSPGTLTGQMESIRFDRIDGDTYKVKGELRETEPLNEELTRIDKSDIKKLIQKEIETSLKSTTFKEKVSDAVTKDVKKNPELEKMVVEITRNVITQLYKVLWMRRTFWRNSLKNVPA